MKVQPHLSLRKQKYYKFRKPVTHTCTCMHIYIFKLDLSQECQHNFTVKRSFNVIHNGRTNKRSHMIHLIRYRKINDINRYPFTKQQKILNNLSRERNFFNLIKYIYQKHRVNSIILNNKTLKVGSLSLFLVNQYTGNSSVSSKTKKNMGCLVGPVG